MIEVADPNKLTNKRTRKLLDNKILKLTQIVVVCRVTCDVNCFKFKLL